MTAQHRDWRPVMRPLTSDRMEWIICSIVGNSGVHGGIGDVVASFHGARVGVAHLRGLIPMVGLSLDEAVAGEFPVVASAGSQ